MEHSRLFTVGPVMMYPETLGISGEQLPYFRTDEFSQIMKESETLLKGIIGTSAQSKVAFLTASGTGAMESAVSNTFTSDDEVLVINGGSFGKRFEEICDVHGIGHVSIELAFGEVLTSQHFDPFEGRDLAGVLVNVGETSTGQLYDLGLISEFCERNGAFLIVDAISSFLADEYRMDDMGVDMTILSSQKALSLSPGLSIVVMNSEIFERRVSRIRSPIYYLDLANHVSNMERGQTPFTPAVGILLELNGMLRSIAESGVDRRIARTRELADYFRNGVRELGMEIPDYPLSNALTPLLFDGNAKDVYNALRDKYGITVTPSGGHLSNRMLRVGHIGYLSEDDYDSLLAALREILS